AIRWSAPTADSPPLALLGAGLMRVPFGLEVRQQTRARLFLEESQVGRALFPGDYDLGVRLRGGLFLLPSQLAMMTGAPVGERAFPGRDPDRGKDLVGRLALSGKPGTRVALEAGLSGLVGTGFHAGSAATKDAATWRDANGDGQVQATEFQAVKG